MEGDVPADGSFLRRLFNRSRSRAVSLKSSRSLDFREHSTVTMKPSPHTHPLLCKPRAREEALGGTLIAYGHLDGSIRAGREGATVVKRIASVAAQEQGNTGISKQSKRTIGPSLTLTETLVGNFETPRRLSKSGSREGLYEREWEFYIKCYAEGRFNLSNPPDPPPRRPDFVDFVAPPCPNETQRLQAVRECNVTITHYAGEKLHRLVILAKKVFQTRMAAISFIDDRNEIFKSEQSFYKVSIPRKNSIGAHVLFSNEPMVVLNTTEDWRFKGNQLVTGDPLLRFYAGAPIMNSNCDVVGVFAIFDTQPREAFTAASRRKLLDFSRLAMAEIELAMDERDMLKRKNPFRFVCRTLQRSVSEDDSPAASRPNRVHERLLKGIEEDAERMQSISSQSSQHRPSVSSGSTKRESIDHPDNLTVETFTETRITITTSPTKADLQQESKTSTPLLDMPTPPLTPSRSFSVSTFNTTSNRESFASTVASSSATSHVPPPDTNRLSQLANDVSFLRPPSENLECVIPSSKNLFDSSPIKSLAEANFATSIIARSLSYDLVYLLRVCPIRSDITHNELTGHGVHSQVLVSHGMPQPEPVFDGSLHLRALRSGGGLMYSNPNKCSQDQGCGYQLGILLPLIRDSDERSPAIDSGFGSSSSREALDEPPAVGITKPDPMCRGGIVLCAFKKTSERGWIFSSDEVRFLREFGEAMKDILIQVDMRV